MPHVSFAYARRVADATPYAAAPKSVVPPRAATAAIRNVALIRQERQLAPPIGGTGGTNLRAYRSIRAGQSTTERTAALASYAHSRGKR